MSIGIVVARTKTTTKNARKATFGRKATADGRTARKKFKRKNHDRSIQHQYICKIKKGRHLCH